MLLRYRLRQFRFVTWADAELVASPVVRRFETSSVKRQLKFAPFVPLTDTAP